MRFYDIQVLNPDGSAFYAISSLTKAGLFDPGALNVEFDIPVVTYDTPAGNAQVKIWGVGLQTLGQSQSFTNLTNPKTIKITLGMSKGLPLANPAQQGPAIQGAIFQSFGNWQGMNQSLDLIFGPSAGGQAAPANIVLTWKKGTQLAAALQTTLVRAFPSLTPSINISTMLVAPSDQPAAYQSLSQFLGWLTPYTQQLVGGNYTGVKVTIANGKVIAYDGTGSTSSASSGGASVSVSTENTSAPLATKAILYTDLIGQPTWQNLATIQLQCIMRGDIQCGDQLTLPQTLATNTASSGANYRQNNALIFQGTYTVIQVRHVGNFRQPTGDSWVTVIDCAIPAQAIVDPQPSNPT